MNNRARTNLIAVAAAFGFIAMAPSVPTATEKPSIEELKRGPELKDDPGWGCPVWSCGFNGPSLDGAKTSKPVKVLKSEDDPWWGCPVWRCGLNGPSKDGRKVTRTMPVKSAKRAKVFKTDDDPGWGCPIWRCGLNGPKKSGAKDSARVRRVVRRAR